MMEWYAGSIVEAIQTAKTSQAFFVVYIEGSDDASKTTTDVLNKSTVAGKLNGKDFVCIKLLKDSEGHQQFAAIYKMVPVPSVFFIAPQTGLATDVVVGRTDSAEVEKKLLETVEKSLSSQKLEGTTTSAASANATVNPPARATAAAQPQSSSSSSRDSMSPPRSDPIREASPPSEPQPTSNGPSLDDKVEKAKQLIALKNEQKEREDLEKAKAAERERRRVGQELHKAKLSRQEQEMREALEERKKNSAEEAAARKKILDQIAQDKADRLERERIMRSAGATQAAPAAAASAPLATQPPMNADAARIQFRLPSGETKTHVFPAETTLTQVRQFIDNNIVLPFSEYQLATTFPRREFTWRDNEQDLRALQLLPSSVLLVLPVSGSVVARPNGWATAMINLFWSLVTPLLNLGNYVSSFIFGGGRRPATAPPSSSGSQDSQRQPPPASAPQSSQQVPYARTTIRKRGNIHTLSDDSDNKDDNNTWNGNSTQQM